MLRKLRIGIAAFLFIAVTLLFLDFTGLAHRYLSWAASLQFLPAVLALNVAVVALLVVVTFLLGRVYCSVICPLGIMQDIIAWFGRRGKKKRNKYAYSGEKRWLRYGVLVVFLAAILAGFTSLASLIAPYSSYGRIAGNILAPVYRYGNNVLAYFAERVDSYAFYETEVWIKSTPVFMVAVVTFIVIAILAWRGGRTWCNTICPVGSVLGLISRHSVMKIRIDESACTRCGKCGRNCKSSCIDTKTHTIDYSRCVACGDCIGECREGAISFSAAKPAAGTATTREHNAVNQGRRAVITSSALLAAGTLLKAQEKTTDGGLAVIEDKLKPSRNKLITPPGSVSLRNMTSHCTSCQLCVNSCPNDVLRPSSSLDRLMQPEVSYERGYCRPECNVCSQVCPTGAILPVTVEQRTAIQVGHAVWVRDNCLPVSDGEPCGLCARKCPAEAIQMVPLQAGVHKDGRRWLDADGKEIPREKLLLIPVVNEEKCIGCGACEQLCPSRPYSAIYVEGHEVHREI